MQDFVHRQYDWGKLAQLWHHWIWPAETPLHGFPKFSSSDHVTTFCNLTYFLQKMKFWLVVSTHLKKYALFKMSSSSKKVRGEHKKSSKNHHQQSLPITLRTLGTWPTSPQLWPSFVRRGLCSLSSSEASPASPLLSGLANDNGGWRQARNIKKLRNN